MPSLWISRLTKTFGTLKAVDDFSLEIASGTVHSLVGENGAGKSTVVKCVYGLYSPTAGKFKIDNKILTIKTPRDAMKYGIGMVHQHFMLVPSLPVYKNVVLGDEPTTRGLMAYLQSPWRNRGRKTPFCSIRAKYRSSRPRPLIASGNTAACGNTETSLQKS